ncbi:MAG: hypothetical protein GC156_03175 [Actinomycetales bacterium]|nr:hypothetical protein [Actinomycetales bacterium]
MGWRLGSRLWWGLVPLLLLLWGAGALATSSLPGLPSTPVPTLALLPTVTFAGVAAMSIVAGCLLLSVVIDPALVRSWSLGWLAVALGLSALGLAMLAADVAAEQPLALGEDPRGLLVTADSLAGRMILLQLVALAVAGVVMVLVRSRWGRLSALALVLIAVAAPTLSGHAGLSGEHSMAAFAIGLHAAAAAAWMGGLAVLVAVLGRQPMLAPRVLPWFSMVALVLVVIVAETGLLSASLIAGSVEDVLGSTYGSLVIAKAVLLAALIALGWQQRRRAVDRLPDASVPRTVAVIAASELVVMGVALAAAVVLARIGPSAIPGQGFAPLTLVALGVAVPMLAVALRRGGQPMGRSLPEVWVVMLGVVVVEVGGVGLLRELLGPLGLALEVALLLGVGWLAVGACRGSRSAVVMLAIVLPVALGAASMLSDRPDSVRMTIVAALAAESLVVLWWRAFPSVPPAPDAAPHLLAETAS